jgi:menaquinone-dependent protoporphyrinogen oxidase
MSHTLIIYSTTDGQTKKICDALVKQLDETGEMVRLISLEQQHQIEWSQVDKVYIGASIRYGHFNKALQTFIAKHQEQLESRPNGFFCVNLTARKPLKNTPKTNAYMVKFIKNSPWQPQLQAVFAGALLYSKYCWNDRIVIQFIMWLTGGVTDTSQDIEYTDWDKVSQFGTEIINHK